MTHVTDEIERSYREWLDDALAQDAHRWADLERELGRLRGTPRPTGRRVAATPPERERGPVSSA